MNGIQASLSIPNALLDILGATGGLFLRAGLSKTYNGISRQDFPWQEVTSVLQARLAVDLLYWKRPIHDQTELLATAVLWLLGRRLLLWKKETWPETLELLVLITFCMLAVSSIVVKL